MERQVYSLVLRHWYRHVERHVERDRGEGEENSVQDETHIQMILNENYRNGHVFHEMVVTDYLGGERIVALECFLIFKKK